MKINKLYESALPADWAKHIVPDDEVISRIIKCKELYTAHKDDAQWLDTGYNYKCRPYVLAKHFSPDGRAASKGEGPMVLLQAIIVSIIIDWPEFTEIAVKNYLGYRKNNRADRLEITQAEFEDMLNSNIIKELPAICTRCQGLYDKYLADNQQSNGNTITEDIEKHDTLNPKLWNDDNTLRPEVADKIMEIVNDFTSQLEDNEIKFKLDDVKLVGSNCSYNYTDNSDLDVHLVMDTDSLECPDNLYPLLYSAYRSIYNKNHDIKFYGIPVEIFVETSDTKQMTEERKQTALESNGIYSVMHNEWIKEPVAENIPELNQEEFDKLLAEWTNKLDEVSKSNDADQITQFIEDLYELRKESIAKDGEYSLGNYVFKDLRNTGKLDDLKDIKAELINSKLSLEALKSDIDEVNLHEDISRLSNEARMKYYNEISRIAHTQAIVYDNGLFTINNIQESEVNNIVNTLKRLDGVKHVSSTPSGKYNFNKVRFNGIPDRYFTIRGELYIK